MVQSQLHELTLAASRQAYPDVELPVFVVTHPETESHGDFSANIALILSKQVGESPSVVAKKIIGCFGEVAIIDRIEVAGPGFINFHLKPNFFWSHVQQAIEIGEHYGTTHDSDSRVMFEFGCPNTHKMPHIGHLFSYCYGESCVRLLEAMGAEVFRENYQGDVGLHVAKCLWALRGSIKYQVSSIKNMTLTDKVNLLQESYQQGALAYEEDPEIKHEIDQLNGKIYNQDPEIAEIWKETRQWSIDYYKEFEKRIGTTYHRRFFESEVQSIGAQIVREQTGKIFEDDEGSVIFRGEPYGLHTRVFINKLGNPTYEAKDVGLATLKLQADFDFDTAIYTTAIEQNEYFKVVFKAIEAIYPELQGKLLHMGFGLINLTTGKMSSRTGQVVTASGLLDIVKDRVRQYIKENRDYAEAEADAIAEIVAIGAVKYSFLRSASGKNITFDIESSVAFEGNSGPYLQYTYARCQSVLAKSGFTEASVNVLTELPLSNIEVKELALLRYVYRYGEVVAEAAQNYAPHVLASYLFELASRFSAFYGEHQIITEDRATTEFRVALTAATAQVLKNGLNLLGIEVADRI